MEAVDADHGDDAAFADGIHMVEQVFTAPLQQREILSGIGFGQRPAGDHGGAASVHFQGPDGGYDHGYIGLQAGEAAFYVPKLFKANVCGKAGFRHMVIEELQPQPVPDDGGLADGDVGKGAGVDQARLVLHGIAKGGVDAIAHPGGHGAGHLQVLGGDRTAGPVVGQHHVADPGAHVL